MPIKDINGTEWSIRVCTSNLLRVQSATEIDLLKVLEDRSVLGRLFTDMPLQSKVLYALCQIQAKERGITEEQWSDNWNGDTLEAGLNAVLESLASFFPKQKGAVLREGVTALRKFLDKSLVKAQQLAQGINVDKMVQTVTAKAQEEIKALEGGSPNSAGSSSGRVPESSESTPVLSPAVS